MNKIKESAPLPYPPAPWRSSGCLWMGLFKTDAPPPLPEGLKRLLNPNWLVVSLIRYLEGTLKYDELVIGGFVRRGRRLGLFVYDIWVDDETSLWGGRRIWGLRKEMADFAWDGGSVRVSDEDGLILTLVVNDAKDATRLPRMWTPFPGLSRLDGQWLFTPAGMWARFGKGGVHLDEWSERFPYRPAEKPMFSLRADPFHIAVPSPKVLRG
jgi:hypothetical protein